MRTLLLLRHAKAVASSPEGDFGRTLAPRGRRQAAQFGAWLTRQPFAPTHAVASPARRTLETARALLAAFSSPPALTEDRNLYNAEADEILAVARATPDAIEKLMIVGHNPGIAELAFALTGRGPRETREAMAGKYPTCACAVLQFDTNDWNKVAVRTGDVVAYVTPSRLDAVAHHA